MTPELEKKLPELCYVKIPGAAAGERIGIVKRGERGYHLTDLDRTDLNQDQVEAFVREMNERLEVSHEQEMAMMIGSMCGWHVPGADPESWLKHDAPNPFKRGYDDKDALDGQL